VRSTRFGAAVTPAVEVGGPEHFRLDDDLIRTALTARWDAGRVVGDPAAPYWGIDIEERTLVPADDAAVGSTRFAEWLLMTAATS
jgi:hypothetical protein